MANGRLKSGARKGSGAAFESQPQPWWPLFFSVISVGREEDYKRIHFHSMCWRPTGVQAVLVFWVRSLQVVCIFLSLTCLFLRLLMSVYCLPKQKNNVIYFKSGFSVFFILLYFGWYLSINHSAALSIEVNVLRLTKNGRHWIPGEGDTSSSPQLLPGWVVTAPQKGTLWFGSRVLQMLFSSRKLCPCILQTQERTPQVSPSWHFPLLALNTT